MVLKKKILEELILYYIIWYYSFFFFIAQFSIVTKDNKTRENGLHATVHEAFVGCFHGSFHVLIWTAEEEWKIKLPTYFDTIFLLHFHKI